MAQQNGVIPITSPPDADPTESQVPKILLTSIILVSISAVAVALRFLARILSKAGLWWDDWTILAAMIMAWGTCVLMIVDTQHGFGKHMNAVPNVLDRIPVAVTFAKLLYVYETVYTIGVTMTKYSILLFYSRIFKEKKFEYTLKVMFVVVTMWFIGVETAVLAECVPVQALWDISTPGRCIDLNLFFIAAGIPNVVLNTVILLLPLPMIWSLEIERRHKVALSGVFMLGIFVVGVSIARVIIMANVQFSDITWNYIDPAVWTSIEPNVAVVSACLPILRSLWVWNRRKRAPIADDDESEDGDGPKNPPASRRGDRSSTKSDRASSKKPSLSGTRYPLKELPPAAKQQPFGNSVTVYSPAAQQSRKSSGSSGEVYAYLPIMHPAVTPPKKAAQIPQKQYLG